MTKICIKCHVEKPLSEFHKHGQNKSGYRSDCKVCRNLASSQGYIRNKDYYLKRSKKPETIKKNIECTIKYHKKRYNSDINYRLAYNIRNRINKALKENYKNSSSQELLGCSLEEFKKHIESQFKPGMSWSNRSEWHIDHKRPIASFDLSNFDEQKICFHYSNLQPLWAEENRIKSDKIG